MKKFLVFSLGMVLCLLLASCGSEPIAKWNVASLRNENGLFVLPGVEPRASLTEVEQITGITLKPKNDFSDYSKDAARIYIPVKEGKTVQYELCGYSAEIELWFDFPDENGIEEIDSVSMSFTKNASKAAEAFRAEVESLWGEPKIITQEGTASVDGKRANAVREMWEWRTDDEEYITVLAGGVVIYEDEVIEFMVEWGTYETKDYK